MKEQSLTPRSKPKTRVVCGRTVADNSWIKRSPSAARAPRQRSASVPRGPAKGCPGPRAWPPKTPDAVVEPTPPGTSSAPGCEINGHCSGVSEPGKELAPVAIKEPVTANEAKVRDEAAACYSIEGLWQHLQNPAITEFIRHGTIHGPDGTTTVISPWADDEFSIEFSGKVHLARLVGNQLAWDDGDIWVRPQTAERFNGRWRHKSSPALMEVICGSTITGPDGEQAPFRLDGADGLSVTLHGNTYHARLANNELVWSDGDVWSRVKQLQGLEGTWRHKGNPGVYEVVSGGTVFGPDGTQAHVMELGAASFAIRHGGSTFSATLAGNELLWDDGDVWVRTAVPACFAAGHT